jgi:hypothetical protein
MVYDIERAFGEHEANGLTAVQASSMSRQFFATRAETVVPHPFV